MAALLSRTCWCSRPRSRWGAPNHALQRTAGHSFFLLLGRPLPPPLSLVVWRRKRWLRGMCGGVAGVGSALGDPPVSNSVVVMECLAGLPASPTGSGRIGF